MRSFIAIASYAHAAKNASGFAPTGTPIFTRQVRHAMKSTSSPMDLFDNAKDELLSIVESPSKPSRTDVQSRVQRLEEIAEQVGIGQASASSGLLNGQWELLYSPEDVTRSSPFFWAFKKAFPEQSDQIFAITDSIPAPIKEVGPAYQTIDIDRKTLVSRVKVATLGGLATSIMTTRCTILGTEGLESIRLRVETTKPEESTVLKKLGPLGSMINDKSIPFPSGDVLDRTREGSSVVIMVTTFVDEGLRISRNRENYSDVFVWKRKDFGNLGGIEF